VFETYLSIFMMVLIAIALGVGMFVFSYIFGYVKKSRTSKETYECGMPLLDEAQKRISIRYYVVLLLFLLFDVETLLLFPVVAVYREMMGDSSFKLYTLLELIIFIGILFVGYIYIYKKGALKWE
jgi:NADH-quinone oxidoreductase subunit A